MFLHGKIRVKASVTHRQLSSGGVFAKKEGGDKYCWRRIVKHPYASMG